jgi:hypothetical protein
LNCGPLPWAWKRSPNVSWATAPRPPLAARCGTGRLGQQFTAGLVRAYVIPAQVVRLLVSRCAVINWHARSPVGGAPQGWQDSNLRHAFWRLLFWPLNYTPIKLKTARWVNLRAAPGLGLLILAVTQLPPRGWAAHCYPGQLSPARKLACTHAACLARILLTRVSRGLPSFRLLLL